MLTPKFLPAYAILLALCGVCVSGCGSSKPKIPTAKVEGKVMLKTNPVINAEVWFTPTSGPASFGRTDNSGNFTLLLSSGEGGAVVGQHQVKVVTGMAAPPTPAKDGQETQVPLNTSAPMEYLIAEPISVQDGQNALEISLDKTKPRRG